jgi:hypothetical protein
MLREFSTTFCSARVTAGITLGFHFGSDFTDYVLEHRINSELLRLWIRGAMGVRSAHQRVYSLTFLAQTSIKCVDLNYIKLSAISTHLTDRSSRF